MATKPLRVLALEVSNIKRIRTVAIAPTSNIVRIQGENGSGKTSTLDSILWALAGKSVIALVPIREGEERGTIRVGLGSEALEYVVTRTFTRDGNTTKLTVESAAGALFPRPQEKLDSLFGSLSLDPLAFQRMKPDARQQTLRGIVKLDVDVDELDRLNAADFQQRTETNRDVKTLTERVNLYAAGLKPSMPVEPIDTNTLLAEMEQASAHNTAVQRALDAIVQARTVAAQELAEVDRLRSDAQELVRKANVLEAVAKQRLVIVELHQPVADPIDVTEISQKVKEAERENSVRSLQRTSRANHAAAKAELDTATARADALTAAMEYRAKKKAEAIAAAKFPVPGLSFGPSGVLYNNLPFDQASAAEQLQVSFAIAAAMRPNLPVVLIKDGSLLDEKSMTLLEQLAAQYDAQIWIERVGPSEVGIVLEDGEIVMVDGAPVERGSI